MHKLWVVLGNWNFELVCGQEWSRMVRDGQASSNIVKISQGWSNVVKHGQTSSSMVKRCQTIVKHRQLNWRSCFNFSHFGHFRHFILASGCGGRNSLDLGLMLL